MHPELAEDLRFFGGSEACLPEWLRGKDLNEFEVYETNGAAFRLFSKVQTQWRTDGYRLIGLDYGVVLSLMDRMQLDSETQLELLEQVSLIECGYLTESAEQATRKRRKSNQGK